MQYFQPDTFYTEDGKKVTRIPAKDMATFYGRAKHLYYIRTKDNQLVTYVPNQGQKIIGDLIDETAEHSRLLRGIVRVMLIILKPRQIGATTDTACRIFDMMLRIPMCNALVTNHLGEDTEIIFDKYQILYRNLADYIILVDEEGNDIQDENGNTMIPLKPEDRADSAKQIRFSEPLSSWINVRTAGSGDNLGKGGSLNCLHTSESANYVHYKQALSSVLQQIPDNAETFVVNESTANGTTGAGEGYYKDFILAQAGYKRYLDGEIESYEGYIPVFVPWYVIDEYQLPLQNGKFVDIEGIDFGGPEGKQQFLDKEILLMTQYDVSPARINWYRYIIKTKCNYSINDANRYYPTFPEDAFLSTDKCFFDSNQLFSLKKSFDDGSLKIPYEEGYLDDELTFVPSQNAELRVYEYPDIHSVNRYIVALDSSKGVEDGDYTSMKVLDRLTEKIVATWHGRIAEDLAAKEFVKLGIMYNYALLIPESNRATVIDLIKPGGAYEYDGEIYYSKIHADGTLEYGHYTAPGSGATSRKLLLDKYKAWLRTNYDKLNSVEDVEEHLSFVRTVSQRGTVRFEADAGKKDDRVLCGALLIKAHEWWEEEVGITNEAGTDFNKIIKIEVGAKKGFSGYKQSQLGQNAGSQVKVNKVGRKQSSLGRK